MLSAALCLEVGRPSVTCCRQVTLSETPPLLRRLACPWKLHEVGVEAMKAGASFAGRLPGPSVLVQLFSLLMSSSTGTKQPTGRTLLP